MKDAAVSRPESLEKQVQNVVSWRPRDEEACSHVIKVNELNTHCLYGKTTGEFAEGSVSRGPSRCSISVGRRIPRK